MPAVTKADVDVSFVCGCFLVSSRVLFVSVCAGVGGGVEVVRLWACGQPVGGGRDVITLVTCRDSEEAKLSPGVGCRVSVMSSPFLQVSNPTGPSKALEKRHVNT